MGKNKATVKRGNPRRKSTKTGRQPSRNVNDVLAEYNASHGSPGSRGSRQEDYGSTAQVASTYSRKPHNPTSKAERQKLKAAQAKAANVGKKTPRGNKVSKKS